MVDGLKATMDAYPVETGEALWIALQICDSGFPGGSFAHSLGLESALYHKLVNSAPGSLDLFVFATLEQVCGQLIPLVCGGHMAYYGIDASSDIRSLPFYDLMHVDGVCHISLTNEVARRSSISQGKKNLGSSGTRILSYISVILSSL